MSCFGAKFARYFVLQISRLYRQKWKVDPSPKGSTARRGVKRVRVRGVDRADEYPFGAGKLRRLRRTLGDKDELALGKCRVGPVEIAENI